MQKIACIGVDPFIISRQNYDAECLPPTESIDLVSYLVLETSYYTKEQFKAFKSLQSYNQLVSGFVQSVHGLTIASKHVVLAKVRHSQKMNDPTVPLWVIIEDDRRILCAHCRGCMAGQGETCSHIASVLFYIETFNRIRGKLACTDKQCEWILPTYSKDIPLAEVQDIDFRSAKKLKQKLDETVEKLDVNAPCFVTEDSKTTEKQKSDIQAPTEAELNSFYEKLNTCKKKPVALSLIYPYSESFVTKSRTVQAVPDLFDTKYLNTQYNELLEICAEVNIETTPEQIKIME